jgi:pantothenate kinase
MSTLSIRIPDSIHEVVKKMSKEDNISINQFIASAITEKVTAMETEEYLVARGMMGNKNAFERVLKKVPNIKPNNEDC